MVSYAKFYFDVKFVKQILQNTTPTGMRGPSKHARYADSIVCSVTLDVKDFAQGLLDQDKSLQALETSPDFLSELMDHLIEATEYRVCCVKTVYNSSLLPRSDPRWADEYTLPAG